MTHCKVGMLENAPMMWRKDPPLPGRERDETFGLTWGCKKCQTHMNLILTRICWAARVWRLTVDPTQAVRE